MSSVRVERTVRWGKGSGQGSVLALLLSLEQPATSIIHREDGSLAALRAQGNPATALTRFSIPLASALRL